jgi:hypothetical protein
MSQHVRMDRERHFRPLAQARNQGMEALWRHRATPLSGEDMRPRRLLALKTSQSANFIALHWMHARRPPLGPANVQAPGGQFDLMPLEVAQL